MSQTERLFALQKIDNAISAVDSRVVEIDLALSENSALKEAEAEIRRLQSERQEWELRQQEVDIERSQLLDETITIEKRLYSGKVQNPRELTDLKAKSEELKGRHQALEDPAFEALLAVEDRDTALVEANNHLTSVKMSLEETHGELLAEQKILTSQREELAAQRLDIRRQIRAEHLQNYDVLKKRIPSNPVSLLRGDECSVCGVQVTSQQAQQVQMSSIVACPTCGRILHHQR